MSFVPKTQAFNAKINAVTLGTGDKAVVLGGPECPALLHL